MCQLLADNYFVLFQLEHIQFSYPIQNKFLLGFFFFFLLANTSSRYCWKCSQGNCEAFWGLRWETHQHVQWLVLAKSFSRGSSDGEIFWYKSVKKQNKWTTKTPSKVRSNITDILQAEEEVDNCCNVSSPNKNNFILKQSENQKYSLILLLLEVFFPPPWL